MFLFGKNFEDYIKWFSNTVQQNSNMFKYTHVKRLLVVGKARPTRFCQCW